MNGERGERRRTRNRRREERRARRNELGIKGERILLEFVGCRTGFDIG